MLGNLDKSSILHTRQHLIARRIIRVKLKATFRECTFKAMTIRSDDFISIAANRSIPQVASTASIRISTNIRTDIRVLVSTSSPTIHKVPISLRQVSTISPQIAIPLIQVHRVTQILFALSAPKLSKPRDSVFNTFLINKITPNSSPEQRDLRQSVIDFVPAGILKQSQRNTGKNRFRLYKSCHVVVEHHSSVPMRPSRGSSAIFLKFDAVQSITGEGLFGFTDDVRSHKDHFLDSSYFSDLIHLAVRAALRVLPIRVQRAGETQQVSQLVHDHRVLGSKVDVVIKIISVEYNCTCYHVVKSSGIYCACTCVGHVRLPWEVLCYHVDYYVCTGYSYCLVLCRDQHV